MSKFLNLREPYIEPETQKAVHTLTHYYKLFLPKISISLNPNVANSIDTLFDSLSLACGNGKLETASNVLDLYYCFSTKHSDAYMFFQGPSGTNFIYAATKTDFAISMLSESYISTIVTTPYNENPLHLSIPTSPTRLSPIIDSLSTCNILPPSFED